MNAISIADRRIGPDAPVYIIAELSANHGQNFDEAMRLVDAAHAAGADAVKLQTYTADTLTLACDRPEFLIGKGTIWEGRTLHDLYQEAYTPWEWQPKLKERAEQLGLQCFSSPFDPTAVEFLEKMHVPAYKIASFELVDLPLIERCAATGKPLIMSTGMATREEIGEALAVARRAGAASIALLKCTSGYPAPAEEMNLSTIPDMAREFDVPVGLSDHTLDVAVPIAAVALGACIIEKHLTMRRADGGPDAAFSLEPGEFRTMVEQVRIAERAVGRVTYEVSAKESASRVFRRSLFIVADVKAGEAFTAANVRSIRPGNGLHTRHLTEILGRRAPRDIARGTPLSWELIGQ
ncbi:MAG TPA: pseudaminic acid synthase [Chthoniobacter sp.]|nr:pseudaminic acid synthase [Chthoniobacter sp.]